MSSTLPVILAGIAGVVMLGLMAMNVAKKRGMLIAFGGLLLFGSIAVGRDWKDNAIPGIWLTIQSYRSEGYFLFGVLLLGLILIQIWRGSGKGVSAAAWLLVLLSFYAATLRFFHNGPADGLFSIAFVIGTVVPVAMLPRLVIDDFEDFLRILRTVCVVSTGWLAMCAMQFVVNPRHLTTGNENRFLGLLSNPQHAAALAAFTAVVAVWLLLNDSYRRYVLVYAALAGINMILIAWAGSRTGMGMVVVGLSFVLFSRAGRAILLLPIVALLGVVLFKLLGQAEGLGSGLDRLASTENTRSEAWQTLLATGRGAPMIGVGMEDIDRSENSWLYAFAAYGIGAAALSVLATALMVWEMLKLGAKRFGAEVLAKPYIDFVLGFVMMYLAGAVFEGYMIARVGAPSVFIVMVLSMGAVLRKNLLSQHPVMHDEGAEYAEEYDDTAYSGA